MAKKHVEKLVEGFSSTFFLYGAPHSGKSYTLFGKEDFRNRISDYSYGVGENDGAQSTDGLKNTEKGIVSRTI